LNRILIADDEEMNREVLRELLETNGYEVSEAADGAEAFQRACSETPSLILMDIRMPRADGFATLARLRAHPGTTGIPVVAVTAFAMDSDRQQAQAAGFDAYVSKPVDFQLLIRTIRRLLAKP
jgi:two-component system cell cycle response regulator DivK